MHSASMPMSTRARVTSTARSWMGREPSSGGGIIWSRGMASLSALRSISRLPPVDAAVSPRGVMKVVPELAAAARRGESASHAATNSTTRELPIAAAGGGAVVASLTVEEEDAGAGGSGARASSASSDEPTGSSRDEAAVRDATDPRDATDGGARERALEPEHAAPRRANARARDVDGGRLSRSDPDARAHDARRASRSIEIHRDPEDPRDNPDREPAVVAPASATACIPAACAILSARGGGTRRGAKLEALSRRGVRSGLSPRAPGDPGRSGA